MHPPRRFFQLEHLDYMWAWLRQLDIRIHPLDPDRRNASDEALLTFAASVVDPDPIYDHYAYDLDLWSAI